MPKFRISIYRVVLIAQSLLLVSLILPGLLTSTGPLSTPLPETSKAVVDGPNFPKALESLTHPAHLIDYLEHHYRGGSYLVELRGPDGEVFFEERAIVEKLESDATWLHAALTPFLASLPSAAPTNDQRLTYTEGQLQGWTLLFHDPVSLAKRHSLPQLTIGLEALLASIFILVMLSILGSRLISRPVQEFEEQLKGIRDRTRRQLTLPENSPIELDLLLTQIEDCISEQQSVLAEAGYSSSLMQQVLENLDTPVLILDAQGALRFSNASARRLFDIGTHPNAWTYIEFAQRTEIVAALRESAETHRSIILPKIKGLPKRTALRALIRGNEAPWILFTVKKKSEHLKAISSNLDESASHDSMTVSDPKLIEIQKEAAQSRGGK